MDKINSSTCLTYMLGIVTHNALLMQEHLMKCPGVNEND